MESQDMASDDRNSPPVLPPDSPGSSVSSRLQEEYTELLKYAVVLPNSDAEGNIEASSSSAFHIVNGKSSPTFQQHDAQGKEVDRNTNAILPEILIKSASRSREATPGERLSEVGSVERLAEATTAEMLGAATAEHRNMEQQRSNQEGKESELPTYNTLTNPSVTEMGYKLDTWLGKLKNDILDEFCKSLLHTLNLQQQEQEKERKNLQSEKQQLQQEVNRLNDLIHTCEESIARKDTLLENLTKALGQQKDKVAMAQTFFNWKAALEEANREAFTNKLSQQHHERQLTMRVFKAWFGTIQSKWRARVERQCQGQAQNVCKSLSTDYEAKIAQLNATIQELENRVSYLQEERENYAESVKKAFMRGVCALNMEAMSAFTDEDRPGIHFGQDDDQSIESDQNFDVNFNSCDFTAKQEGQAKSLPSALLTSTTSGGLKTSSLPPESMRTSLKASQIMPGSGSTVSHNLRKTKPKGKSTTSSTAPRPASSIVVQGQTLAPPMATVIVERHQPITKQTVGKATALKYPKTAGKEAQRPSSSRQPVSVSQNFRPIAGQTSVKAPQSIKVVD